jgi:hypothetical protein
MAIPRKGSRTITLSGAAYRWRIRSKSTYEQGASASNLSIAVERVSPPSQSVLLLKADFPRPDNWLGKASNSVTPGMVEASIRSALAAGWLPDHPGSAFAHPLRTDEDS